MQKTVPEMSKIAVFVSESLLILGFFTQKTAPEIIGGGPFSMIETVYAADA